MHKKNNIPDGLGNAANSWYEATAHNNKESCETHPLNKGQQLHCDVCIIGAGFTGLSAALELTLTGHKVIVLEARTVGFGASGRNGGQIIGGWHHSYKEIGERYGSDIKQACYDISEQGKKLISERIKKYNIQCNLQWGYTHLALKQRHVRSQEQDLRDWQDMGYQHGQLLSQNQVKEKLNSKIYLAGLHDNYSGQIHSLNYCLGLAQAARSAGAKIYCNTPANSIDCDNGEVIINRETKVTAKHVVIAGNAYVNLKPIVPKLYKRIMPVISNIAATQPLTKQQIMLAVRDQDAYADYNFIVDYFRMSHDNRLLFGGRASYADNEPKNLHQWMHKRMIRVFPALKNVKFDYVWGGRIGITTDRLPDIGQIGKKALYAQGYSGHGVLLSNMCGKIIADAINNKTHHFNALKCFKHRNFPLGPLRKTGLVLAMLYYRLHDAF